MRNIRLTLAYDGSYYVGWQVQPNGVSVQAVVEAAILKLTGEPSRLMAAGRTDSGVHAFGQVANFTTESNIPCEKLRAGLQNFLPEDVAVRDVSEVDVEFHSTYSAKSKSYRYVIHNSRVPNPLLRQYTWRYSAELDADVMQQAANTLLGTHDFRCFESHFPNKATSVRTIFEARVERHRIWNLWSPEGHSTLPDFSAGADEPPPELIVFDITGDGFLYNMVRAIVGTLVKVGRGTWSPGDVTRIIEDGDRSQAGETAPAHGLYLVEVKY